MNSSSGSRSSEVARRILLIDDNPDIHTDVRKVLAPELIQEELAAAEAILFGSSQGASTARAIAPTYQIDSAYQGHDGVAMAARARSERRPYCLALVDCRMPPGMDGIQTIAQLWEQDPAIPVVLCTAYSDYSWQEVRTRLPYPERLVILKKPFDGIELQQLAESLTEKWRLGQDEQRRLEGLERQIRARNRDRLVALPVDSRRSVAGSTPTADAAERRRVKIEHALQGALQSNQFSLQYQPLVEIATRCIVGLEALLRWQHPQLGVVSPGEFIPIAEATGMIAPIGEWVLRSACAQLVRWERKRIPVVPVAVNVSAVQLQNPGLWDRMRQIMKEEGAQPQLVTLELTESTLIENAPRHAIPLRALRDEGVSIEIDDFGTGYSSLSCLKHLPLDAIKIDRSFVTHLATSKTDESIVAAILAMAHSLGLRVVAEGVESAAQLEVLGRYGCEVAQGYYFCKPVIASECEELLLDLAARTSFTDTLRLRKRSSVPILRSVGDGLQAMAESS